MFAGCHRCRDRLVDLAARRNVFAIAKQDLEAGGYKCPTYKFAPTTASESMFCVGTHERATGSHPNLQLLGD